MSTTRTVTTLGTMKHVPPDHFVVTFVNLVKNGIYNKTSRETNDSFSLFIDIRDIYIGDETFTPVGETFTPTGEVICSLKHSNPFHYVSIQMDIICFTTLPLKHLNLHISDVKLLQKPSGKNMRSVFLYNPSKTQ
jgi:hypothetical protein